MRDLDQRRDGRGLMVGPLVFPDPPSEAGVVVGTAADVDDEEIVLVVLVEVFGDVVDRVAIGLFEETARGVCHGDDTVCYVGKVKLLPVEGSLLLGPSDDLAND